MQSKQPLFFDCLYQGITLFFCNIEPKRQQFYGSIYPNLILQQNMSIPRWFFYLLMLIAGFLLFVLKYGNQGFYQYKKTPFSRVYDNNYYSKLRQQINSNRKAVLFGYKDDGIQQFVEDYLNRQINNKKHYEIYWRQVKSGYDIEFKKHPFFSYSYYLIKTGYSYILDNNQNITKFWVLNNIQGLCHPINRQLTKFVMEHSLDKILIICKNDKFSEKKLSKKNTGLKGFEFQILKYARPQFDSLIKGLVAYSANKTILQNMVDYYQKDLSKLNHLFLGEKPINTFLQQFRQQFNGINSIINDQKCQKILKKLCKKGEAKISNNSSIPIQSINIISSENNQYLWSSSQALYAYQIKSNKDCVVPHRFAEPRQIVEIPELNEIYPMFQDKKSDNTKDQDQQEEEQQQ